MYLETSLKVGSKWCHGLSVKTAVVGCGDIVQHFKGSYVERALPPKKSDCYAFYSHAISDTRRRG